MDALERRAPWRNDYGFGHVTLSGRFAAQLAGCGGMSERQLGQAMDRANARPMHLAVAALAPQAEERILDAACGTGAALAMVRAAAPCRLYGIDPSQEMVAAAGQRLGPEATLACAATDEIARLGWQPFDALLALNMLYFDDTGGAMVGALRETLVPGGRLVAYVIRRRGTERWRTTEAGLRQDFDASDLAVALVQGGFAPESISITEHVVGPEMRGLIARAER